MIDFLIIVFLLSFCTVLLFFRMNQKFRVVYLVSVFAAGTLAHALIWPTLNSDQNRFILSLSPEKITEGLDGYSIERRHQGVLDKDRNPIIHLLKPIVRAQFKQLYPTSLRIFSLDGMPLHSKAQLDEMWKQLSPKGVGHFRIMNPTPDNALSSIFVSPSFFEFSRQPDKSQPLLPISSISEYFGLDGIPIIFFDQKILGTDILYGVDDKISISPLDLQAYLSAQRFNHQALTFRLNFGNFTFGMDFTFRALIRPRLLLLPWVSESPLKHILGGPIGTLGRLIQGVYQITPMLFQYWEYVPKQWYLMDDKPTMSFWMNKMSSFCFSLFLALVAALGIQKGLSLLIRGLKERRNSNIVMFFAIALVILFQACDLLIIRLVSI